MVDYFESLYNGAKDAGASVEAIGMSSLILRRHGANDKTFRH